MSGFYVSGRGNIGGTPVSGFFRYSDGGWGGYNPYNTCYRPSFYHNYGGWGGGTSAFVNYRADNGNFFGIRLNNIGSSYGSGWSGYNRQYIFPQYNSWGGNSEAYEQGAAVGRTVGKFLFAPITVPYNLLVHGNTGFGAPQQPDVTQEQFLDLAKKNYALYDSATKEKPITYVSPDDVTQKGSIQLAKDESGKLLVTATAKTGESKTIELPSSAIEELARFKTKLDIERVEKDQDRYNLFITKVTDLAQKNGAQGASTFTQILSQQEGVILGARFDDEQTQRAQTSRTQANRGSSVVERTAQSVGNGAEKAKNSVSDFFGSVFKTAEWKENSHSGKGQQYETRRSDREYVTDASEKAREVAANLKDRVSPPRAVEPEEKHTTGGSYAASNNGRHGGRPVA